MFSNASASVADPLGMAFEDPGLYRQLFGHLHIDHKAVGHSDITMTHQQDTLPHSS